MEQFLLDFGLRTAARTATRLYMAGSGSDHHIHITELGPPGFIGFAYHARSEDDLHALAKLEGASAVESIDEPGGGKRVVLREPNGFPIEVVYGIESKAPAELILSHVRHAGEPSTRRGPARVMRLAHGVLATPKLQETLDWFADTLGFIKTDDLFVGTPDNVLGSFYRIDAGDELVDHHVIFCMRSQRTGMHHVSFEVEDVNDVFTGHDHLVSLNQYEHIRGIGRHALGSQIFDYWVSPWDQMHEHWSSNERFNASSGSGRVQVGEGMVHDHGPKPSERFIKQVTPAPLSAGV
jgi:catechol 2,3-dioxygenase-like lactoylglutathione lyase family enzyme